MKSKFLAIIFFAAALPAFAQDNAAIGLLEEKVNKLRAELEDLQFRQQKTDKAIEAMQSDLKELRRNAGTASSDDLKALEAKIAAVDAARQKDNKALVDELARQLAALGTGAKPPKPAPAPATETGDYVVQKGDTLTSIARQHKVTVAALRKATNLASDTHAVGQKLTLPN